MKSNELTASGLGIQLSSEDFIKSLPKENLRLLREKGAMLVRELDQGLESMSKIISSFGELVEYTSSNSVNRIDSNALKLHGQNEEIGYGNCELPLHADGYLFNKEIDHIFLYAREAKGIKFQGATTICDCSLAYEEMPIYLRNVLDEEIFETKVVEKWFQEDGEAPKWVEVPVLTDLNWCRKMLLYLPFQEEGPKSWETRIKGFSEREMALFFSELVTFLQHPRYYYKHYWKKGDLIIIDNRRVLHGRKHFGESGTRVLYRWQTKEKTPLL